MKISKAHAEWAHPKITIQIVPISTLFHNVVFPSLPNESFRITCEPPTENSTWKLWLENRRTRLQYELSVISLKNYGPEDIPAPLVCHLLQKTLATCEVVSGKQKEQEEDAQVDGVFSTEGITIYLTLNMSSLWFPVYSFVLTKKDVGEIEIIKSQLKDALEEIQKLRNEARYERAFLSLSSALASGNQDIVRWNAPDRRIINPAYFTINTDSSNIIIRKRGLYQVCVRLAGINNQNNTSPVVLLLDGIALAECVQSDALNHQNSAHLNQMFELEAGADLSVRSCFNHNSRANSIQNTLNISLLEAH